MPRRQKMGTLSLLARPDTMDCSLPFAFQFLRVAENEVVSAVVIICAAIASHIVWNIGYVANATLVDVYGKTPEDKATLASSRATWNQIGGLAFSYLGLPSPPCLALG